jgi:putative membrane protein
MARQDNRDPAREAVERGDTALKESLGDTEITDPTVFVKSAALGEITAIELAKLAQSKTQSAGIHSFAARVLTDHEAIRTELAAIARRKKLDVPTSLVYEDEERLKEAEGKTGAEFDGWFTRQMLTEHQKAIGLFQGATRMQDADFATFAKKTLPTLETHQRLAMALVDEAGR